MQLRIDQMSRPQASQILPICADELVLRRNGRALIDGLSIALTPEPKVTVILGPNGAGKSVLLRLLAGLVSPDAGAVLWQGRSPCIERSRLIGFVFQKPVVLRRTVQENVEYVLRLTGVRGTELKDRAYRLLVEAGLSHVALTQARVLSGGEQQRLALARAMGQGPEIFFLDEPTSTLDPASTAGVEDMVHSLRASGTPVVLVTHDLGQARRLADDVVFMHQGRLIENDEADAFFSAPQTWEARSYLDGQILV